MQRADQRAHHYVYRIDRFDGKYYIGMHSTDDLNDGYLGSGTYLTNSVRYYGRDKHVLTILEHLPTRKTAKDREKELITDDMRAHELCMNLAPGGGGGIVDDEHQRRWSSAGGRSKSERKVQAARDNIHELMEHGRTWHSPGFSGKSHSEETIQKLRVSKHQGEDNPQFGTCWVTNCVKPIKIKKERLNEYLANGYSRGRK